MSLMTYEYTLIEGDSLADKLEKITYLQPKIRAVTRWRLHFKSTYKHLSYYWIFYSERRGEMVLAKYKAVKDLPYSKS